MKNYTFIISLVAGAVLLLPRSVEVGASRPAAPAVSVSVTGDVKTVPGKGQPAGKKQKPADKAGQANAKAKSDSVPPVKQVFCDKTSMLQVSKEKDEWYFTVPDSLLGRLILTVTRFTATPAGIGTYGGEEAGEQTVYFEMSPDKDKLLLRSNILYNQVDSTDEISQAVRNASEDPILAAFKIEKRVGKAYKIKVGSFFVQDNSLGVPAMERQRFKLGSPVPGANYIESIHSYPINTEVRTVRTYTSSPVGGPTSLAAYIANTVSVGLNVSFVVLPKDPMPIRLFDPRVGYFTDSYYTFKDNQQSVGMTHFVTRYRLEPKSAEDAKRQQAGELIEPKKQIVYYIDPATPKKWRPYLIAGVKDWNVAFEQAGWKNAITAKEWPEGDSTMSLEDARYSVIRYLASSIENAYGPQVHDPRSGEIIESHVGWYHNVMSLLHSWYMIQTGNVDPKARTMKFDDHLMGQLIRFVSSHEIGHTLGLRHNFGSSSTVPVDSLRSAAWVHAHGHTPSIMDYARFNYVAQPGDGMTEEDLFPRIGDYDKWAIEWGYKPVPQATDAESDRYFMDQITTQRLASNRRLWWGDGEKGRPDPRCQTEDLGDDAVKASTYGILNLQRMINKLPDWTYWGNDVNSDNLKETYDQLCSQLYRYVGHVRRNLNGYYFNQKTVNEKGAIYEPVPRAKEKAVLPFFDKYVFHEPTWLTNVSYFDRVSSSKEEFYDRFADRTFAYLVSSATLDKMCPNYPVSEYLPELEGYVFKELKSGSPVSAYRRMLQRKMIDGLVSYFNANKASSGSDATACVLLTLQQLRQRTAQASRTASDRMTRAHYAQLSDQISRALVVK